MSTVQERFEAFPFDQPPRVFERREDLLLAEPIPSPDGRKRHRDQPPIEAVHFPPEYIDQPFAHPRAVYESEFMRLEWQTMNNRQPFYHRNCDVDEISYQVTGVRTLMTDLGTVDLHPGDFSRLPVGCAHDNYGRQDIHVLFYIPAPVAEALPAAHTSEVVIPPFDGWAPAVTNELITECLGGTGHDIVMAPVDELTLLEQAKSETERLHILRPPLDATGNTALYTSAHVHIGRVYAPASDGRVYRRIRNAQEIQYQLDGERTLVTQRGTVHLVPGDFVRIPVGVAFTSLHASPSAHVTVTSALDLPQIAETTKHATPVDLSQIARLREEVAR
ncbi:hypothetical protein DFR70_101971 [Nocardia tenerifensis]|uniref:Homogentisate 1,2-dioxygenase n=1 Tax=Nocardia tenerifensis TaxID=228006 RepID=A0A318KCI4_9NOCA|nr:hypothetical protein [Nocardia tenerifensis]PXX71537.1 hypothetical protein DFR70_101971 [Nocardia tenerifensis]